MNKLEKRLNEIAAALNHPEPGLGAMYATVVINSGQPPHITVEMNNGQEVWTILAVNTTPEDE